MVKVWLAPEFTVTDPEGEMPPLAPAEAVIVKVLGFTVTTGWEPLSANATLPESATQVVFGNALVVHVIRPVVPALAVNVMATLPVREATRSLFAVANVLITPPLTAGVVQELVLPLLSVATTLSGVGVPNAGGTVTATQPIMVPTGMLVFVTVRVYCVAVPRVVEVGPITAVNRGWLMSHALLVALVSPGDEAVRVQPIHAW